jgi:uncharacterized protein
MIHQSHKEIIKRLLRADGHLRCVISMIEDKRPCPELAQQLHAVERAISEAKRALIHDHADHCLDAAANGKGKSSRATLNEFKTIAKYLG